MAFYDNPIVDENSNRSEESINMLKLLINRKSNFICREEAPDYGVDLDVELIHESGTVSANKFAIQVKSTNIANCVVHEGTEYISLNFKTSRLGYLCRRSPGYGIITIYIESSKTTYFEYVENVCARLNSIKDEEIWKNQESVNIHIPLKNILNVASVASIYHKMCQRFINHDALLSNHGNQFDIPFSNVNNSKVMNANEIERIAPALINAQEFTLLLQAINSLSNHEIIKSEKLCLFAAISNCELGNVIEAKNYMTRCIRFREKYNVFNQELIMLYSPRIEFILGNLTLQEFEENFNSIKHKITNRINKINVELNLLQLKIYHAISTNEYSELIDLQIVEFDKTIKELDAKDTTIYSLSLLLSDAILTYSSSLLTKGIIRENMKLSMGISGSSLEKEKYIARYKNLTNLAESNLDNIYEKSIKSNNSLISAEVLLKRGKSFLYNQTCLLNCDLLQIYNDEIRITYGNQLDSLQKAYYIFVNEFRYLEAHYCLNYLLEISELLSGFYHVDFVDVTLLDQARETILEIENLTGIKKYELLVKDQINLYHQRRKPQSFNDIVLRIKDNDVHSFAKTILEINDLPEERLVNIKLDIENHRHFYSNRINSNLELLQDRRHAISKDTKYKSTPKYIIRNTKTGFETTSSTNINELLEMVKHINKLT